MNREDGSTSTPKQQVQYLFSELRFVGGASCIPVGDNNIALDRWGCEWHSGSTFL